MEDDNNIFNMPGKLETERQLQHPISSPSIHYLYQHSAPTTPNSHPLSLGVATRVLHGDNILHLFFLFHKIVLQSFSASHLSMINPPSLCAVLHHVSKLAKSPTRLAVFTAAAAVKYNTTATQILDHKSVPLGQQQKGMEVLSRLLWTRRNRRISSISCPG